MITVETSWLNRPIEERLKILRRVAPRKADGISILVNEALKDEWEKLGPKALLSGAK